MFVCGYCEKEFKTNAGLWKHQKAINKCAFDKLNNEMIELKDRIKKLEMENKILHENPTVINQHITNTQQNLIQIQGLTQEQYFESKSGLPSIEIDNKQIQNKIETMSLNMKYENPSDVDLKYFLSRVFKEAQLRDSIMVRDKNKHYVDIKYNGKVKQLEYHNDLLCDLKEFSKECISKAIDKGYKKAHLINDVTGEHSVSKCKKYVSKKFPDKQWKAIQGKQVVSTD